MMKNLLILLLISFSFSSFFAQNSKMNTYDEYALLNHEQSILSQTKEAYGKNSSEYLFVLFQLYACYDKRDQQKALKISNECLKVIEFVYGKDSPKYIIEQMNGGIQNINLENYKKGIEIIESVVFDKNKEALVSDKRKSTFLINIAATYEQFGDYPKAIEYYQKALSYENNVFTSEDFQDFKIETLLSSVYTKLGDYNQSQIILKKIYNKCCQILNYNNSVWLDNRLEDVTSQSELAFVYERLGDMNTANQIIHQNKGFDFENSINPKLKNLYFNQIKMVFNQANDQIAENYYYLGDLDSSMKYCELQYENYNEISSSKSLLIKSWIYLDENNIEKASEYARLAYLQAKLSWSKLEVCPYLIQLAKIKNKQKNYNEAIEFATKSSNLVLDYMSEKHPYYFLSQKVIAESFMLNGEFIKAQNIFEKIQEIQLEKFKLYEHSLNENLRIKSLNDLLKINMSLFEIYNIDNANDNILNQFNNWCFLKGRDLSKSNSISSSIFNSGDSLLIKNYQNWIDLNKDVARIMEMKKEDIEKFGLNLEYSKKNADKLERQLLKSSSFISESNSSLSFNDLESNLSEQEIYIDVMLHYSVINESSFYYAYLIKKGYKKPVIIKIGNADELNSLFTKYTYSIMSKKTYFNSHDYFWSKFENYLNDIKTIYFAPDGLYSKINPNILYSTKSEKYLMDDYNIININCIEDFVNLKDNKHYYEVKNSNIVLFGNPTFFLNVGELTNQLSSNHVLARDYDYSLDSQRGYNIKQLPGTLEEINNISSTLNSTNWNIELVTHKQATEFKVKNVSAPRVLHIATHGYFLPKSTLIKTNVIGDNHLKNNPLLRSGLLFAGAQNTSNGEYTGLENGWLNAYEASFLNLRGTELVVLSACETGRGEIINGKGVYGLQRAIRIAGAESIIMSMWKVSDVATQKLMTYFYEFWIKNKLSKKEALTKAQNKLKIEYPAPFYWGAFILIGT